MDGPTGQLQPSGPEQLSGVDDHGVGQLPGHHPAERELSMIEADGLGLVEVLIAGVILLSVMTSIGRFTQAAMTSGSNQDLRNRLESRIMDNMQKIHQQDSRLTWEAVKIFGDEQIACSNPAQYAK